jgi:hypothetical protein
MTIVTLRRSVLALSVFLASSAAWSNEGMLPAGDSARAPIPELVLRKTEIACTNPQTSAPPTPIGCTID